MSPIYQSTAFPNVRIRSNSIYLRFKFRAKWIDELYDKVTRNSRSQNKQLKEAADKLSEVKREIARDGDHFNYLAHFPNSSRAEKLGYRGKGLTFADCWSCARDIWLSRNKNLSLNTINKADEMAKLRILPTWGHRLVADINAGEIMDWFTLDGVMLKLSNKTKNNYLPVFRKVFKYALLSRYIDQNPMLFIENFPSSHTSKSDPFHREEIAILLASIDHVEHRNLIQFAIWSGLRLGELAALAWEDIHFVDEGKMTIDVRRQCLREGIYQEPKAGGRRQFSLVAPAVEALQSQRQFTGDVPVSQIQTRKTTDAEGGVCLEQVRFVFRNTNTGRPYTGSHNLHSRLWLPIIKRSGVRPRPFGQTRHTFASQCVSNHIGLEEVARMMGHTTTAMVRKHYGCWLPQDSPDRSDALNEKFGFKSQVQPSINESCQSNNIYDLQRWRDSSSVKLR